MDQEQSLPTVPVDQGQTNVQSADDVSSTLTSSDTSLPPVSPGLQPAAPTQDPINSAVPPAATTQKLSPQSPSVAEDVDLIEKEWVIKAKQIIASTSSDPNKQSNEISKFKADYVKTRYDKDLKVSD